MSGVGLRGWLAIGAVALVLTGVPGREAAASPPHAPESILGFNGVAAGEHYFLFAIRPGGKFRRCAYITVTLATNGAAGCQRPGSASRELAQHATVCGRNQVVIAGLVPATVARLHAVVAGRSMAVRLKALPHGWRVHGSVWLLVVRPAGTPATLHAVDADGAVVGTDAVPAASTTCPAPTVSARGTLPGGPRWRVAYSTPTGTGATPNVCTDTLFRSRDGSDGEASCLPAAEIRPGPVMDRLRAIGDDPPGTMFTGLLHLHASGLRITLDDGSTVTARILHFPARAHTPFAAYVAAVPGHHRAVRFTVRRG